MNNSFIVFEIYKSTWQTFLNVNNKSFGITSVGL